LAILQRLPAHDQLNLRSGASGRIYGARRSNYAKISTQSGSEFKRQRSGRGALFSGLVPSIGPFPSSGYLVTLRLSVRHLKKQIIPKIPKKPLYKSTTYSVLVNSIHKIC
jgi:hypothetical protein